MLHLPKCMSCSALFVFLICLKGVSAKLETIFVNPGDRVKLHCPINYTKSLSWTGPPNDSVYAVGPDIASDKMKPMLAVKGSSLILLNVSKIHGIISESYGIFKCFIGPEQKHQFNVTIRNPPFIEIRKINGTNIRCIPQNFQANYTFCEWEHRSEYGDHIRFLNGTISSDNRYTALQFPFQGDHDILKERGIYICKVKSHKSGRMISSKEYFLQLEGKPYFVASNDLVQNGTLGHESHLQVKFVSYPNITSHSLRTYGKDITNSTNYTMKEDNFTDIIYGQTVMIRGYLLQYSFVVTSKELFNEYLVTVGNCFGETKTLVTLDFSQFESDGFKPKDTGLATLQVFLIITGVVVVLIIPTVICVKLYKVRALKRRQRNTRSRPNGPSTFQMHKIYLSSWDING